MFVFLNAVDDDVLDTVDDAEKGSFEFFNAVDDDGDNSAGIAACDFHNTEKGNEDEDD
jgi:hypothetical protein